MKNAMMDGNLVATAVEATTRVLILEVAVILTAPIDSKSFTNPEDNLAEVEAVQQILSLILEEELRRKKGFNLQTTYTIYLKNDG